MGDNEVAIQPDSSEPTRRSERAERIASAVKSFRVVIRAIQAHSQGVQEASGLSHAQLWLLWEVFGTPGMKVSELATRLSIKPSTASNLLHKVELKGLIRRDRVGPDQRVVSLHITGAGAELLSTAPRPAQGALLAALNQLANQQLIDLNSGMQALLSHMQGSEESDALMPLPGLDPS